MIRFTTQVKKDAVILENFVHVVDKYWTDPADIKQRLLTQIAATISILIRIPALLVWFFMCANLIILVLAGLTLDMGDSISHANVFKAASVCLITMLFIANALQIDIMLYKEIAESMQAEIDKRTANKQESQEVNNDAN